jgi:hypothetical protein
VIATEDEIERWAAAAGLTGIIRPELLRDPMVRVLLACDEQTLYAGAIVNRFGAAVGLSNVFGAASNARSAWRDLPAFISDVFAGLPITGYEYGSPLAAAVESGFEILAPLTVWPKP